MKHWLHIGLIGIVMCLFLGCSNKTPEEKYMDYMVDYAKIIIKNDGDCEKSAKLMNEFTEKNKDNLEAVMTELIKESEKKGEKTDQAALDKYKDELSENEQAILDSPKCKADPKFVEAQANFAMLLFGVAMKAAFSGMADAMKDDMKDDMNK